MSINQRRFIRFSLNIPAIRHTEDGEKFPTVLLQISVGGCMTALDEGIFVGDEFRLEVNLPNGNRLPFFCRALYKFPGQGIGVKFLEITEFEQRLLGDIISQSLENEGLPLQVNPFAHPPTFVDKEVKEKPQNVSQKLEEEDILDEILA